MAIIQDKRTPLSLPNNLPITSNHLMATYKLNPAPTMYPAIVPIRPPQEIRFMEIKATKSKMISAAVPIVGKSHENLKIQEKYQKKYAIFNTNKTPINQSAALYAPGFSIELCLTI